MIQKLLIGMLVVGMWIVAAGATARAAEFSCKDRVLVDYARALEQMPSNRLPGRRPPYAPRNVKWQPGGSILVKGEPISFTLALGRTPSGERPVAQPARLDWTITMNLHAVNRKGWSTAVIQQKRWELSELQYPGRQFAVSGSPGLYRVALRIQKVGGSVLARYWQYIRVLPVRQRVGIVIKGDSTLYRGETATARVENRGTLEVGLLAGSALMVEHLNAGQWSKVESEEPGSVMFENSEFVPAGWASRCSLFTVPDTAVPGLYRVSSVFQARSTKARKVVRLFTVS